MTGGPEEGPGAGGGARGADRGPERGPGLFVVVEGIEGAGKSTQVALLSEWLAESGIPHTTAREPGGTAVGEAIREVVLGRSDLDVPPTSELLLILAARAAFVREVVRPALSRGGVVLADRFDLSTLAYQGHGRELGVDAVRPLNRFATGGLRPDVTLLLDLPLERGLARQREAGKEADRMEGSGRDFLERVADGYRELAVTEPHVETVDADAPEAEVQERLRARLRARFPGTFPSDDG